MSQPRYYRPETVEEAAGILQGEEQAFPLAGGTDLLVQTRAGLRKPVALVDLGRLGMDTIHHTGDAVVIGATCSMSRLRTDPTVNRDIPLLAHAAARLGGPQIQNMATIGGNLGNASPAADGVCALAALNAEVMLRSRSGVRSLPVREFLLGPGKTALERGELIQAVSVPVARGAGTVRVTYGKVGARNALVCSIAAVAGWTRLEGDRVVESRLALGAVGPTCLRATRAEELLGGETLTGELVRTAAAAAAGESQPIDDHRATGGYRRRLVAALVREHLTECMRS